MLKEQSWLYLNDGPIRAIPITYLDSAEVHRINMTRKINKGFELVKMLWRLEFTSHQLADAQERLFAEWREKKANELGLFDIRLKSRIGIRNFAFDPEQQSWSFKWDTVATKDILTLSVVFNFVSNEFQGEHHPTMRLICEQYAFDSVAKAFSEWIESVACVVKMFAPGCAKRPHVMDTLQKQKGWLAQFRARNSAGRNKVMRCVEPCKYSVFQEYKLYTPMVIAFGQTKPNKQPLVIDTSTGSNLFVGTSTTRTANTTTNRSLPGRSNTATATATATKRALESAAKPSAAKKTRLEDDSRAGGSNGLPNAANGVESPSLPSSSATEPRASSSSITTTTNQARSTGRVGTTKSSPIPQTATGSAAAKRSSNKQATQSTNRSVGTLKPTNIHTGALPKQSSSSASRGPIVFHQVAKPSPPPPSAQAKAQKQNNKSTARVPNILRRAKKKTPVKPTGVVLMQHQQQLKKKNVAASAKSSPNPQAKNGPSASATVPIAASTVPSAASTGPSAASTVSMPPPPKPQNKSVPRKPSAKQPQPLEFQNKKRLAALALKQKQQQQKVVNVEVKTEMEESSTITEINVNSQAGTELSVPPSTQANTPTNQNVDAQGNDEQRNEQRHEQGNEQRNEPRNEQHNERFDRMSNGLRNDFLQNAKVQAANELAALGQVVADLSVPKPQSNSVQPEESQTVPINPNQNTNNKPDDSRVVFFDNTSEKETQPPPPPAPRETLPRASGVVAVRVLTGQPNPAGILAFHEVEVASSEALPTTPEQAIVAAAAAGDQMRNQSQNMNLEVNGDQAATLSSSFPASVTVQVGPVADTTTTEQVETKEDVKPNIADLEKKMIMLNSGEDDLAIMINLATYDQENFCQEVLVALQQERVPIKGIGGVFLRVNMYRVRVTRDLISKMASNGVYHYELSGDPNDDQRDVTLKYAFLIEENEIVLNNANK